VRVLDQIAHDHQHEFPTAAKVLKGDVLTEAHTEEELIRNQNELIKLMTCAGMKLGTWVSSSSHVADRSLATTKVQGKGSSSTAKAIGIQKRICYPTMLALQQFRTTPNAKSCQMWHAFLTRQQKQHNERLVKQ